MAKLWKGTKWLWTAATLRVKEKLAVGGDVVFRTIVIGTMLLRALDWITTDQAFVLFVVGVSVGVCAWHASGRTRAAAST
jgi:hypothetical protein